MEAALQSWSDFNVAMVGATAALAGLVIVAGSVNITRIVESGSTGLIGRLASSIASLVLALIASGLGLLPGITEGWFGGFLVAVSAVSLVFQIYVARMVLTDKHAGAEFRKVKAGLVLVPSLAYLVSGVAVLVGHPSGLYLAALGCAFAIIVALLTSWVALVEVLR